MNSLLNLVNNSFMINLMNGKVLTISQLKNKWDRVCEQNAEYITGKKNLEGMGLLNKMYLWASDHQIRVADIKTPFKYSILKGEPQVIVRGEVAEAIVPLTSDKFELLEMDFSRKYPDQAVIDMKLKYTMDIKVCQSMFRKINISGVHIHHVASGKDWYTVRGEEQVRRMNVSLRNVASAIHQRIFYPRETSFCSSCDMKNYCRVWRG